MLIQVCETLDISLQVIKACVHQVVQEIVASQFRCKFDHFPKKYSLYQEVLNDSSVEVKFDEWRIIIP